MGFGYIHLQQCKLLCVDISFTPKLLDLGHKLAIFSIEVHLCKEGECGRG